MLCLSTCAPRAEFVASASSGEAPVTVTFANSSRNASEFHWDFGDGATMVTSAVGEPVTHEYIIAGTHTVTLIAIKDTEQSSTMSLAVEVKHGPFDHVYHVLSFAVPFQILHIPDVVVYAFSS